jgi:hypothetical protein
MQYQPNVWAWHRKIKLPVGHLARDDIEGRVVEKMRAR